MSDLIERLRAHAALHRGLGVDDYDEQAQWARDLLTAVDEIERLTAALRHEADCVEAAKAEIERLKRVGIRAVIALAAATDQMPVFAADYAAVSDALKEQR